MTPTEIIVACVIVGIASFAHSVAGFGFSLLAVAPLGLVIDPKDAVAVSMIFLVILSALVAVLGREDLDWAAAKPLLQGAVPGLPLGMAALAAMSATTLRIALTLAIVYSASALVRGFSISSTSRNIERVAGFGTGFLTTSINANGPPTVLVLQARQLSPKQFRPTTSSVLGIASGAGLVLFTIGGRINADVLSAAAWSSPGLVVGWGSGHLLSGRLDPEKFRMVVLGLLGLAAVATLAAAINGS